MVSVVSITQEDYDIIDIIKNKNGDFIVKVEFPENDWVYGYILSFGENVKVLSPGYVKSIIKEKLQKSLKNYF